LDLTVTKLQNYLFNSDTLLLNCSKIDDNKKGGYNNNHLFNYCIIITSGYILSTHFYEHNIHYHYIHLLHRQA